MQQGISYFIYSYNSRWEAWPQKEDGSNDIENDLDLYWGNPGAAIVGYLWHYKDLVPRAFLDHVTDVALSRLRGFSDAVPAFADICYLQCAKFIDAKYQDEIVRKIASGAMHNLQRDHFRWEREYFIKPYWYAMDPNEPLYSTLKEEIDACLDFDIRTQNEDGSIKLTFLVTGDDAVLWKSIWTLESLRVLKAYHRIEGTKSK